MNLAAALANGLRAALGVPAIVYALAAIGLNLQFGYGGLLNVGQVGFMLVGAYGTAMTVDAGAPLWVGVLVGVAAAVLLGLALGLSTLRVRGDHLAIVTLSAAEILRLLARSRWLEAWTGGVSGIRDVAGGFYAWNPIPVGRYGVGDVAFSHRNLWVVLVGWATVAACTLAVWRLVRSPWGRLLLAVRDDEEVVRALGKPAATVKVQALVIGGVIGALGGMLLALDAEYVSPDFWVLSITTYTFAIVVIGGRQRVVGPILGSMVFWFVLQASDTLLRQALADPILDGHLSAEDAGPIRFAVVGLVLIWLMAFRPGGVLGAVRPGPVVAGEAVAPDAVERADG